MKKLLIIFLLTASMVKAQSTTNSIKELIVQVPQLTEWKVYKISKQLSCIDGLRFLGYFKERSCLLLHIDEKKILNTDIITVAIHHLNEKLKTEQIKGYSIYDVLDSKLPP